MDKQAELNYMLAFAEEAVLDSELVYDQLRALWTAYCMHHNLDVDTAGYDQNLKMLWERVSDIEEDAIFWSDLGSFGNFLAKFLV